MVQANNILTPELITVNTVELDLDQQNIALIRESGLFDEHYYNEKYRWLAEQGIDCVEHYYNDGERNNRTPNQYFYPDWYRDRYISDRPDLNLLCHYITEGRFRGFLPSPFFDPGAYISQPGHGEVQIENALLDWLDSDRELIPPVSTVSVLEYEIKETGLFADGWYAANYPQVARSGLTPLQHYVRTGREQGLKPNPYFDSSWYLAANPHVKRDGIDPLIHYAKHGWRNGKDPSLWYSRAKHSQVDSNREPLNDYLRTCLSPTIDPADCTVLRGSAYSNGVFKVPGATGGANVSTDGYRDFLGEPGFQLIRYYAGEIANDQEAVRGFCKTVGRLLVSESMAWLSAVGCLETVASLFQPPDIGSVRSRHGNNILNQFVTFMEGLARQELVTESLWFNADVYRRQTQEHASNFGCLKLWVLSSESDQFIPNNVFDPDLYAKVCGMEFGSHRDAFRHFLAVGIFRNLKFNTIIELPFIKKQLSSQPEEAKLTFDSRESKSIFAEYLLSVDTAFGGRHQALFKGMSQTASHIVLSKYLQSLVSQNIRGRLLSGSLHDQIVAASMHDSKVVSRGLDIPLSTPPFNSQIAPVVRNIRNALSATRYDTIVLIPHCRMSGATKIAGRFMNALAQQAKSEKMLLVLTDLSVFEHPEWFPDDASVLDLSKHICDLSGEFREMALLDLIIGVRADRVVNVNSRLGWQVFERYGERLATMTSLYAYMFCYDLNKDSVKVGYPSEYFISTFKNLKKVFLDSDYLRQELTEKNRLKGNDLQRLQTLYTPVDVEGVRDYSPGQSDSAITRVYWAGRLDRQKNFGLVIDIARQMPDVQFECWGEEVIGDYVVEDLVHNITLNKPYQSIDQLDMDSCDLWLYTSLWDGIPNLLLEVGLRGVPLVSSGVWGVNDLLNNTNSWVVTDDIGDAEQYVEAIRCALADRTQALARAGELKSLVLSRHNKDAYALSVGEALVPDQNE